MKKEEKNEFRTHIDKKQVVMDSLQVVGITKPSGIVMSLQDGYTPVRWQDLKKNNGNTEPFHYPQLKKAKLLAFHLGYRLDKQYRDNIEILKPKTPVPLIIRLNKGTEQEADILVAPTVNQVRELKD